MRRWWAPTCIETSLLEVNSLDAGFGRRQVLHDVSFSLAPGEVLALIGPNGAGKSTVLKAIFGLLRVWDGKVLFRGESVVGSGPADNLRRGIALAPQGEKVFSGMSVLDNLVVGSLYIDRDVRSARLSSALSYFPVLRERLMDDASKLSGGEKQMVALARTLLAEPRLLLLDEPSAGLAPSAAEDVFTSVGRICGQIGAAAIVVEHRIASALRIASRVCALKDGRVAFVKSAEQVLADRQLLADLFI